LLTGNDSKAVDPGDGSNRSDWRSGIRFSGHRIAPEAAGALGARHSLRPWFQRAGRLGKTRAKRCGEIAKLYLTVITRDRVSTAFVSICSYTQTHSSGVTSGGQMV
jgi:hypothetical protein